jgi:hypothetical protein
MQTGSRVNAAPVGRTLYDRIGLRSDALRSNTEFSPCDHRFRGRQRPLISNFSSNANAQIYVCIDVY